MLMKQIMIMFFVCLGTINVMGNDALRPVGNAVPLGNVKDFSILIPEKAATQEKFSAAMLADYLEKIFKVKLPVVQEPQPVNGKIFSVGNTVRARAAGITPDPREQAYKLAVADGNLYILGGTRGPIYGVIALLEEDLECRWYAADDVPVVPVRSKDELTVVPRNYAPTFEIREPLYSDAFNASWATFNRIQPMSFYSSMSLESGGELANAKYFVHTYAVLIPSEKYFDKHPEYFPLRGGKRCPSRPQDGQLCYSNPEVARVIAETLEEEIIKKPGTRIYSVSENDNNNDMCECSACRKIIETDGVSGAQLYLANAVAARLAVKYPDIKITTLAYVGSQKPPRNIKPGNNTVILYAPIRQRFNPIAMLAPIGDIKELKAELTAWHQIAPNIYLWDYVDLIEGAPKPFPNFDAQDGGWKFLADSGVNGVFMEGCFLGHGSLGELKSWLYAKKLWNPQWPQDELIKEFVASYYGPAAAEMAEYVSLQRQAWANYYHTRKPGAGLVFSDTEIKRMYNLLSAASKRCGEQSGFTIKIERELLTLLCLSLSANPVPDKAADYSDKLKQAKELIDKLNIKSFGEGTSVKDSLLKWSKKLKRATEGDGLPQFSENSIMIKKPVCRVETAKYLQDATATTGYATRQGGGNNEWGVQWQYDDFLDLLKSGITYIVRMRVKPEFKAIPQKPGTLFGFCSWTVGGQPGIHTIAVNFSANDKGEYRWVEVGKLQVVTPNAVGCLYSIPGNNLTSDDAVWYDYLEFVPEDEFKDKALADKLPLIKI